MSLLSELIQAFQVLPGVGPKSAQRMSFHLLQKNRESGSKLAEVMKQACEKIKECSRCRTFTENTLCKICSSDKRDPELICVVESPADLMQIESATLQTGFSLPNKVCQNDKMPVCAGQSQSTTP